MTGLSGRTHSVTGPAPGGLVAKSAKSCASAASFANWTSGSDPDLYGTGQAAAAAQQGMGSQGSGSVHRLASPAEAIVEQQWLPQQPQQQSPLRKSDRASVGGQRDLQEQVQPQAADLDLPPTNVSDRLVDRAHRMDQLMMATQVSAYC